MKAVVFNRELKFVEDYEKPELKENEVLIKPKMLGICNTDEEITKGYMGYNGVLGHEFVGIVEDVYDKKHSSLIGKRVAGEINLGCNNCIDCFNNLQRHCKNRQTLGIFNKDGCFSEYFTLPFSNLVLIPDNVDDETAVFIEPLAAAFEIFEQIQIKPMDKVAILGDGKLGLCISTVMSAMNVDYVHIGKHIEKLQITKNAGGKIKLLDEIQKDELKTYDIVIEATGSVGGFETSLSLVRPRGILVLKSTIAAKEGLNLASVVVDEITVIGSRCGRFEPVIRLMEKGKINTKPLITKILPFEDALKGFELNRQKDTIKILLKV